MKRIILFIFLALLNNLLSQTATNTLNNSKQDSCLNISSEPSHISVYLNNKYYGETPISISHLKFDQHRVLLKHKDYYEWSTKIDFNGEQKNIYALMQKKSCSIQATSNIPGANISINNQYAGKTPKRISGLGAGIYDIEISINGYEPFKRRIILDTYGTKVLHTNFKKQAERDKFKQTNHPDVIISANTDSAQVFVDSAFIGITPCAILNLDLTGKKIEVKKEDFFSWETSIDTYFEDDTLRAILTKKTGRVQILSDLPGIYVFIDEKPVGQGENIYANLSLGEHEIVVQKEGYRPFKRKITLTDFDIYYCVANLTKSWININCSENDINVLFDGEIVGTTSQKKFEIIPSDLNVGFQKSMYEPRFFDISLDPQQQIELSVKLLPKTKDRSIFLSYLFPGLGQYYSERYFTAYTYYILSVSGILGAIGSEIMMGKQIDDYNKFKSFYSNAISDEKISLYRKKIKKSYHDIQESKNIRNIFLGAIITTWAVNLVDAYLYSWPKFDNNVNIGTTSSVSDGNYVGLNLEVEL